MEHTRHLSIAKSPADSYVNLIKLNSQIQFDVILYNEC
jgi:hypothetical protein